LRDANGLFNTAAINIPATTSATNGVIQMANTPIIAAPGISNLLVGEHQGSLTFTGQQNAGVGARVMDSMTTGDFNAGVGYAALFTNSGTKNTGMGYETLYFNTGNYN